MKDYFQIILIVVLFAFSGYRIYQKYVKKDGGKSVSEKKSGSSMGSGSKDDDYEPYQKR